MRDVELLAPGGDADSVKAAILAGASAVFLGVAEFNARRRAKNIELPQLEELLALAHQEGVKLYITLNTLLTEEEFPRAIELINKLRELGIDALIVQDYGLLGHLKREAPELEIHASTQMTTHNSAQLAYLSAMGVEQVNFARELSLDEIRVLNEKAHTLGMKSELFVHGAYCVSYSGQCYFSTNLYGMSGNKGTCVQPCRREFSGEKVSSCSPFNLKDNSAYSSIEKLVDAGADSLKIEGRVKSADYVHTVVKEYAEQLHRVLHGEAVQQKSEALSAVFNRDFTDGYLQGDVSKSMFSQKSKDQSLVKVGTVVTYGADRRELKLKSLALTAGSEVHIRDKQNNFVCKGRIKKVLSDNSYQFIIEDKMKGRIYKGYTVYQKQTDLIDERLAQKIAALAIRKPEIKLIVTGVQGEPLNVQATLGGQSVSVQSTSILETASARALTIDTITEKMGKLGGTGFSLGSVTVAQLDDALFLPIKELNEMKRAMVSSFESEESDDDVKAISTPYIIGKSSFKDGVALLINTPDDLQLASSVDKLFYEMPQIPGSELDTLWEKSNKLIPWFQPILNEQELSASKEFILRNKITTIVAENSGLAFWAKEQGITCIAGPHFNLTNSSAVETVRVSLGVEGVFLSKELDGLQTKEVQILEGVDFYFPLVEHQLLMNSKSCLVRNTLGCHKESIDEDCLDRCNRSTFVAEKQGKEIAVMKRTGFHNQIFQSRMRYNKSEFARLKRKVDYWFVDLRNIESRTSLTVPKEELLQRIKSQIESGGEEVLSSFESVESAPRRALS